QPRAGSDLHREPRGGVAAAVMGKNIRLRAFLFLVIASACGRDVSVTLVDSREPRPGLTPPRVEWGVAVRRGGGRPDTIPKIRVKFAPVVRGDSVVGVSTQDGYANATFAYNVRRHTLKRSILP